MLEDDKELKLPAITVFSLAIKYLRDDLVTACKYKFDEDGNKVTEDGIHWVLTVPAIWDDAAKQFMREAAENVSFICLLFVLCSSS